MQYKQIKTLNPFIIWVGGKRKIAHKLIELMPKKFNHYYEPFVGGGAVFLHLQNDTTSISDLNAELITVYEVVKHDVEKLMKSLDKHTINHSEDYFYIVRDEHKPKDKVEIASRFLYLNKTCFYGVYRVNKKGEVKLHIGRNAKKTKEKLHLYDRENLLYVSEYLQSVHIQNCSFENIQPQKGDFVYFDPPYHKTCNSYTKEGFGDEGQKRLAEFVKQLTQQGVYVMVSNSDTPLIRELYKGFTLYEIEAPRSLSYKGMKMVKELVLVNYY